MIVLPQPSCHNRLKSLNSFSVGLLGTKLNAGFDLCERALPLDKNNIRALDILAREYLLAVKQGVELIGTAGVWPAPSDGAARDPSYGPALA